MAGPLPLRSSGAANFVRSQIALRLTSKTASQISSSSRSTVVGRSVRSASMTPATFTTVSRPAITSTAVPTRSWICCRSRRSTATTVAVAPVLRTRSAVSSAASALRSARTTCAAPCRPSSTATARPIPCAAPVTMQRLSSIGSVMLMAQPCPCSTWPSAIDFFSRNDAEALRSHLAADAGHLVTAERGAVRLGSPLTLTMPVRMRRATATRRRGRRTTPSPKAVRRVVRDLHRLVEVVVGEQRDDRPEDLLLRHPHGVRDVGEQRRLDVPAVARGPGAAATGGDRRPLAEGDAEVALDPLPLGLADQRPDVGVGVHRVPDGQSRDGSGQRLPHVGLDRTRHQHAGLRDAQLARDAEGHGQQCRHEGVDVGVGKDHGRALAAELEGDAGHPLRAGLHDHARRSRCCR